MAAIIRRHALAPTPMTVRRFFTRPVACVFCFIVCCRLICFVLVCFWLFSLHPLPTQGFVKGYRADRRSKKERCSGRSSARARPGTCRECGIYAASTWNFEETVD